MAVAAVADDVQHDVTGEAHAEFGGHAGAEHHRFRVVPVHVQDRRLDRFRHIGAIETRVGVCRHRGEADLVVDDQVDRAAGAVADQLAHRQSFVDQSLPSEGRVAMHQNGHHGGPPLGVPSPVLARADLADDDGIDRFQVRRIGLQGQMHHPPGDLHVDRGAQMVFHVAGALHVVRLEALAAEFAEHGGQRFLDDVDERVQAAAMRHADGDFLHAALGRGLDHGVQGRDGDLAAFQAEALGGDVAALTEDLEPFRFGQLAQDGALGVGVGRVEPGGAFDPALDPGFLLRVLDVHEFHGDRPAIGIAQNLHDFAQGGGFAAEDVVDEDGSVEVGVGKSVGSVVQFGVRRGDLEAERVEAGFKVAADAVGADQHQRAEGGDGGGANLLGGESGGGGALLCFGRGGDGVSGCPGGAGGVFEDRPRLIIHRSEQIGEAGIDGGRVGCPSCVLIAQKGGIRATERGCQNVDAGHRKRLPMLHRGACIEACAGTRNPTPRRFGMPRRHVAESSWRGSVRLYAPFEQDLRHQPARWRHGS